MPPNPIHPSDELNPELHPSDELNPQRPWTVVFYSFRGGVGRTTLAVNAARNIPTVFSSATQERRNVFILDFDLEAPGVDEFELLRPPSPEQKGLVEYVQEYRRTGVAGSLRDFVYFAGAARTPIVDTAADVIGDDVERADNANAERHPKKVNSAQPRQGLWVMRAGRCDAGHRRFLSEIDWDDFYRYEEGELFFRNLRVGAAAEFNCGTIIVDSRTGLTEIGSICTGFLADAIVFVFQPTTAHQRGLEAVVNAVKQRERREGRPIPRLYVASKIRALHEGVTDPEEAKLAREIVKRCEGEGDFVEGILPDANRHDVPDLRKPALAFVPMRSNVLNSWRPDAFLVSGLPWEGHATPLELDYAEVNYWVEQSRKACADAMADRRELARY